MGLEGTPVFLQISGKLSDVIFHGGTVGNGILLILTVLSVVSWTIMIEKFRFFRRSRRETGRFLDLFATEHSLRSSRGRPRRFRRAPRRSSSPSLAAELEGGRSGRTSALDKLIEAEIDRDHVDVGNVRAVSRDDRVDLAAPRSLRHGMGDHGLVSEHGRAGLGEPLRRRPGNRRGAHHDDLRARRRDSRGGRIQLHPAGDPGQGGRAHVLRPALPQPDRRTDRTSSFTRERPDSPAAAISSRRPSGRSEGMPA